jgi:hypothetical protein
MSVPLVFNTGSLHPFELARIYSWAAETILERMRGALEFARRARATIASDKLSRTSIERGNSRSI